MAQAPTSSPSLLTRAAAVAWVLAFLIALGLYGSTASGDLGWADAGEQQLRMLSGQIEHRLGLALSHPLQIHLGSLFIRLTAATDISAAATAVSVIPAALTIANLFVLLYWRTRSVVAALLGAASLLVAHTCWQHATQTECYALVLALLTAEWLALAWWFAQRRPAALVVLFAFSGLGLANHLFALLVLPVNVIVVGLAWRQGVVRLALLPLLAVAWLVGSLPYTGLVIGEYLSSGDLGATLTSALFGTFREEVLATPGGLREALLPLGYVAYNFPNLALPLATVGLFSWGGRGDGFKWVIGAEFTILFLFAYRYDVPDQYVFFLPAYAALAYFAGCGAARVLAVRFPWLRRGVVALALLSIALNPVIYSTTAALARERGLFTGMVGNKPYRDGYQTFFIPWSHTHDHGRRVVWTAARFTHEGGLVLVEDNMIMMGVRVGWERRQFNEGVDLRLVRPIDAGAAHSDLSAAAAARLAAGETVVLVPRDADQPALAIPGHTWRRVGDLYVLTPATNPSESSPMAPAVAENPLGATPSGK